MQKEMDGQQLGPHAILCRVCAESGTVWCCYLAGQSLDSHAYVVLPCIKDAHAQAASHWNQNFHELRRFREEYAAKGPGFRWRDRDADFSNDLAKWHHKLPEQFAQRTLLPDQVSSLH